MISFDILLSSRLFRTRLRFMLKGTSSGGGLVEKSGKVFYFDSEGVHSKFKEGSKM